MAQQRRGEPVNTTSACYDQAETEIIHRDHADTGERGINPLTGARLRGVPALRESPGSLRGFPAFS